MIGDAGEFACSDAPPSLVIQQQNTRGRQRPAENLLHDLWCSWTMQPYMSLTVHYINNKWSLRSICLQTASFPDDHTEEIIAHGLKEALSSWGLLEDRLTCMTTDSGTNIRKALKDNNWPSLQCFGHKLHNAIGKNK